MTADHGFTRMIHLPLEFGKKKPKVVHIYLVICLLFFVLRVPICHPI